MLLSNAISFVRARLDEIAFNQDDMISAAQDDRNLDTTVERLFPEAAEVVFLSAPAHLLEAETTETKQNQYGAVNIVPAGDFLRLVYVKASDSDIYVSNAVPFNSPEARMQEDKYTRGTPDAPVLVQGPSDSAYVTEFHYYSMTSTPGSIRLAYIKKPEIVDGEIFCPRLLSEAVFNELTAMVLETYGDQRAQLFHQKVTTYLAQ